MNKAYLLLGVAVALVAVLADDPFCGNYCVNNGNCAHVNNTVANPCTRCNPRTHGCAPGLACGERCAVDTDCNQNGKCTLCQNGTCTSDHQCFSFCDDHSPCSPNCATCQNNTCLASCGGACNANLSHTQCSSACGFCLPTVRGCGSPTCCTGTYCETKCEQDSDCGKAPDCSVCSPTVKQCVKLGCGSRCATSSDCNHTGEKCTTCYKGFCTSNCGGSCHSDTDCSADCTTCSNGKCTPGKCGARCLTDAGCDPAGCGRCSNSTCVKAAQCGGVCENDLDCDQNGNCPICPLNPGSQTGTCTYR